MKADTEETRREVANKQTRKPCRIGSQPRPRALQDAPAASLPSKSIPLTGAKGEVADTEAKAVQIASGASPGASTAKKSRPVTVEEVEDEDAPSKSPNITLPPLLRRKRNPIYYSMKKSLSELMARQLKVPSTSSAVMGIERF
ncbi:hypothetical protein BGY98DRAFT_1093015 [Russula aff. rugulosa BPL654]|nr:hypothetical protein BGY98DRAFT_1093015 [Russula aff. rugulosa BPL654]